MFNIYDINGNSYIALNVVKAIFETGDISQTDGSLANSSSYNYSRTTKYYSCLPNSNVYVTFDDTQFSDIQKCGVAFYTDNNELISYSTTTEIENPYHFVTPQNSKYFKLTTYTTANEKHIEVVDICSTDSFIDECFNPNIINSSVSGSSLAFNYHVARDAMTSGRLLLPPNYTVNGDSVPLIVYVHGSKSMLSWNAQFGKSGETVNNNLPYLANEGFAVFDCYPWTNKESIASEVYSPVAVSIILQSYLQGIKYVCDRFNIDINKVSVLCKSQGGHFGHWATVQNIFPFKTVSLFAPSTGTKPDNMFFNSNLRTAMTKYAEFDGTSAEISAFISSGNISNSSVSSFCEKNKAKLVNLYPFSWGIENANYEDLYEGGTTTVGSVPQWMLDDGLPSLPSGAAIIYAVAQHDEYVKSSYVPTKFWVTYDDTQTSAYVNYAIYRWLQNGGSDTAFRVLPNNSGGHYAMDTSPDAPKSSGTTALGIAYSDVATAYVEVVEFIRLKGGD